MLSSTAHGQHEPHSHLCTRARRSLRVDARVLLISRPRPQHAREPVPIQRGSVRVRSSRRIVICASVPREVFILFAAGFSAPHCRIARPTLQDVAGARVRDHVVHAPRVACVTGPSDHIERPLRISDIHAVFIHSAGDGGMRERSGGRACGEPRETDSLSLARSRSRAAHPFCS